MLERTFQLIPGVGPWRERDLWARGILSWSDFPQEGGEVAISKERDRAGRERIAQARAALAQGDLRALRRLLPRREHWRLYPHFKGRAAFFDIEADGDRVPTVASVFDRSGPRTFIRGRNLDELPAALAESELWVSFNGSVFDVPALVAHFGKLPRPALHLDLRFLCQRIRLNGGLKSIEDRLGLSRPLHLRGVAGFDAILLWRAYQETGDVEALRFLVEYNLYDSINLRSVVERGYNLAAEELAFEDRLEVFDRGEVLYDLSKLLLGLGPTQRDLKVLERLRGCADRQLREDWPQ